MDAVIPGIPRGSLSVELPSEDKLEIGDSPSKSSLEWFRLYALEKIPISIRNAKKGEAVILLMSMKYP
jgi:hypothetical protein